MFTPFCFLAHPVCSLSFLLLLPLSDVFSLTFLPHHLDVQFSQRASREEISSHSTKRTALALNHVTITTIRAGLFRLFRLFRLVGSFVTLELKHSALFDNLFFWRRNAEMSFVDQRCVFAYGCLPFLRRTLSPFQVLSFFLSENPYQSPSPRQLGIHNCRL